MRRQLSIVVAASVIAAALASVSLGSSAQASGANDHFADAGAWSTASGLSGSVLPDMTGATVEPGERSPCDGQVRAEPDGVTTRWYRIVPPSGGTLSVSTYGSTGDTCLAVYDEPSGVGSVPMVAVDDGYCDEWGCEVRAQVDVQVVAGAAYYVQFGVRDCSGTQGIEWSAPPPPRPPPAPLSPVTFSYTGGPQRWVVPGGVTRLAVDVQGAQGAGNGHYGGRVVATVAVTPGDTLHVFVGQRPPDEQYGMNTGGQAGGFNGGGSSPSSGRFGKPGAGGGASDVRWGGATLADRKVVAGGGGGGGGGYRAQGGAGGSTTAMAGETGAYGGGGGGGGGTPTAGGAGGTPGPYGGAGGPGSLGAGGNGGSGEGGGAGGGYYGGGGGGGADGYFGESAGGGGGGSSFAYPGATDVRHEPGWRGGHGIVTLWPNTAATALEQTFGGDDPNRRAVWNSRADPVNTASGAFSTGVTDASLPGPGDFFRFGRSYTSADPTTGPLGKGWTHAYNTALLVQPDGRVTLRSGSGAQLLYVRQADGAFSPPAGSASVLRAVDGGYELTRGDQVRFRFDGAGKLTSVKDRSDRGVDAGYGPSGALTALTDSAGRSVSLSYDAAGHLSELRLPDGRSLGYGYTGDLLTSVTGLRGEITTYSYDQSGRLNDHIDPNGAHVVRNVYGAEGRVVEQLDPLGNRSTFSWDAATQTSTMTDAKGESWIDVYAGNVLVETRQPNGTTRYRYDAALNRISVTDPRGKEWTSTYDAAGNVLSSSAPAPLLHTQRRTFDARNNPLSHTDGRGNTTTFGYDTAGRLATSTGPRGLLESRSYTAAGQLATLADGRGNATTYGYDQSGNLTSVTSASGARRTYTYDPSGRPLTMVEPRGNAPGANPADYRTTWSYDEAGHVLTETDPLGRVTSYGYDMAGNRTSTTDPAGNTTTSVYNPAGELVSETAPDGSVTSHEYDARGLRVATTTSLGHRTSFTYDGAKRMVAMVEARGNEPGANPSEFTWVYGYDANGNRTSLKDPLGAQTFFTYDAAGRLAGVTDANGHGTTYEYDANGNRVRQTNALSQATSSTYDHGNRLVGATDPRGKTTTYAYDTDGNRTRVTSPTGAATTWTYDVDNRVASVVSPLGNAPGGIPGEHATTWTYDPSGHQITQTDPLGRTSRTGWDRTGRLESRTDPNNHTTRHRYDAVGQLNQVVGPDGATTTYTYDAVGNRRTRTDANGHVTSYDYDADGNQTRLTRPTGERWDYRYDATGRPTTTIDARANAAANPAVGTTTASFDRVGRLTRLDYSDATPDVSFGYDPVGNRVSMADGLGVETRAYDDAGQLVEVRRGADVFAYGYDGAGNVTGRAYPDGTLVASAYGADNRLASVTAGGSTTGYGYDVAGQLLTTSLPNGIVTTRAHDRAGRLERLTSTRSGSVLSEFAYTRDSAGNPTRVAGPSGTQAYAYDTADRLTSVCYAASCTPAGPDQAAYSYDLVGNRLSETKGTVTTTYAYDASDRLTSTTTPLLPGPTAYGYDANGNQTAAGGRSFTYDAAGRMTATSEGSAAWAYGYDGDGRRVRVASGPSAQEVTSSLWDTTQALPEIAVERDGAGGALRRYTYGTDRIGVTAGAQDSYYLNDGLGSVTSLTSSAGATQARYAYDPFGGTRSATQDDPAAPANPMRFTGQPLDPTGLYHLRARQYDPGTGRFTATDPLVPPATDPSISAYAYANNRPTVLTDPTGLRAEGPYGDIEREFGICISVSGHPTNCDPLDYRGIAETAGYLPVLGDLIDAGLCWDSLNNGSRTNAAIDCAAIIPIIGSAARPGKHLTQDALRKTRAADSFPDETVLVRGGLNKPENFANGSGVVTHADGTLSEVSVFSGDSVESAVRSSPIKNGQVGSATVGDVRAAGGTVEPTPTDRWPNHCSVSGLTASALSGLFKPTVDNPCR